MHLMGLHLTEKNKMCLFKVFSFILFVCTVHVAQSKECYSCEGINCLRTLKINNKATCTDPVDNCVTVFEGATVISRGCYSTLPEEHRNKCDGMSGAQCHKCYKSLCNDKGAISCLQCNSQDNENCGSVVSRIEPSRCPVSTTMNSYCFTRKNSGRTERGCLTDTSEQLKCLADNSCEMCIANGEGTCNRESADDVESGSNRIATYGVLLVTVSLILIKL